MDTNTPKLKGYGKQQGDSGTVIFKGLITQEEYNYSLTGQEARRIFDVMRRSDATVHAALMAVKLPIRALDFTIEPASDDEADVKIADYINHELFERNINFADFLRECLTMLEFGFSVFEKVYELTEYEGQARLGLAKISSRKQRSIRYWITEDGKPGVQQQLIGDGSNNLAFGLVSIEEAKLIIFTNDREGDNYEGVSLLRFAFKDWDMKDKLGLVNAIALEKMAVGVPVLTAPDSADPAEIDKAEAIIRNMRANEESFLRVPTGWTIEMLDMKASSVKDVLPTIEYHNHQIMLSVLAQFLMLGSGKGASGSRATSKDHSDLFMLSEEALVKNIVATIQHQLITQLCDLNFSDLPNGYPQLKSSRVSDDDVTTLATAMNQLTTAGLLTPDADLEQFARESLHAPDLPDNLREGYDLKHQQSATAAQAQIDQANNPQPTDPKTGKPVVNETAAKDTTLKPDPKTKASAIAGAQDAKRILEQYLGED